VKVGGMFFFLNGDHLQPFKTSCISCRSFWTFRNSRNVSDIL